MNGVYPNAPESCNGLDDDCDGNTDEEDAIDKSPFYADTDADGFGDSSTVQYSCPLNQPTGFVDNLDDCDDSLASVYPNAQEYCNEIDDSAMVGLLKERTLMLLLMQ